MHYLCNILFTLTALESTIYSSVRFYALLARVSFISYFSKPEKKNLERDSKQNKPFKYKSADSEPLLYFLSPSTILPCITLMLNHSDELLLSVTELQRTG